MALDSHPVGGRLVTCGERVWGTEAPAFHLCPVSGCSRRQELPVFILHRLQGPVEPRSPGCGSRTVGSGSDLALLHSPAVPSPPATQLPHGVVAWPPLTGVSSEDPHSRPTLGCLEAHGGSDCRWRGRLARPRGRCWACVTGPGQTAPGPTSRGGPRWSDSHVCSDRPLTGCRA